MKNNFDNAQYYKKSIERFSQYNEEETRNFFTSMKYGTVVMSYPNTLEQEIYKKFALMLKKKYTKYCDENEIVDTLSSYGNIYTAQIRTNLGSGLYHINSSNILVYSFLNKLDENIVHELIHKLGFLKFNNDFYEMPKIISEAGTELMTNTVLDRPNCRELLLGNLWSRSVGVQPSYLIETSLLNQLNIACGNNPLERSLLEGKNHFETEIGSLIGEDKYRILLSMIKDICRLEKRYWKGPRKSLELEVTDKIDEYQDMVLHVVFGKRIAGVKNMSEAREILNELMQFSDYRVKSDVPDEKFKEYFKLRKQTLEKAFNTHFDIDDISDTWEKRYPIIKLDETQYQAEKEKIDSMAQNSKVKYKKGLNRLFGGKNKKILDNSKNELKPSINLNNNIDYSKISVQENISKFERKIDDSER